MTVHHRKPGQVTKLHDLFGNCAHAIFGPGDQLVGWRYKDGIFDVKNRQVAWAKGSTFVDRRGYQAESGASLWRLIPLPGRRVSDAFLRALAPRDDEYD
jgi:hypothetical protein